MYWFANGNSLLANLAFWKLLGVTLSRKKNKIRSAISSFEKPKKIDHSARDSNPPFLLPKHACYSLSQVATSKRQATDNIIEKVTDLENPSLRWS